MGQGVGEAAAPRLKSRGTAMVEYSVVVGLIAAVAILVIGLLGIDVFDLFDNVQQLFDPTS
jgi:Flp pilus assembly pilin Flp